MLSAKTERGERGNPYRAVQKSNEGQNPAVDTLTFERYRTNQKVKAKPIENSLRDDVGFKWQGGGERSFHGCRAEVIQVVFFGGALAPLLLGIFEAALVPRNSSSPNLPGRSIF